MNSTEFDAKVASIVKNTGATDLQVTLAWENVCVYSGFAVDDCSEECLICFEASLEGQAN